MAIPGDEIKLAIAYLEREAYGRAEVSLKRAIERHPDNAYLHSELVYCFAERDAEMTKWRACDDYYETAYMGTNPAAIAHFVWAEQFRQDQRYPEAAGQYRKARDSGLTHPAVDLGLARVYRAIGNPMEARNSYEVAMQFGSCFLPALHEYAAWEFSEGSFRAVLAIVQRVEESLRSGEYETTRNADQQIADLRESKRVVQALEGALGLQNDGRCREALLTFWPAFLAHKTNCLLIRNVMLMFVRANWHASGTRRMSEAFPGDGTYDLYAQGQVAWHREEGKEAFEYFSRAIDQGLEHPFAFCARGATLAAQDRNEEAEKDFLRAHSRDPHLTSARVQLANCALKRDDHASVLQYAELSAEEVDDAYRYDASGYDNVATLEYLALKALLRQGKKQLLLTRAREAKARKPHDGLRLMKGIAFAANGLEREASAEISQAIRMDESVVRFVETDDRSLITHLAKRFPENYEFALADALFSACDGDMQGALTALTPVGERFENEPGVHLHLGRVAWLLTEPEIAEAAMRKSLELDPSCKEAQIALCGFLLEQERNEDLLQAIDWLPNSEPVLSHALDAAKRLHLPEQERAIAIRLAELYPGNERALDALLSCSEADDEATIPLIQGFCEERPLDLEIARGLSHHLLSNGRADEARNEIERSIALGDRSFQAILHFGLMGILSGETPARMAEA
jgi:tetratricopeptide (TPR) repeat protein